MGAWLGNRGNPSGGLRGQVGSGWIGVPVGRRVTGRFALPLRRPALRWLVAACLLAAGLLGFAARVHAGALYRCTGAAGEAVFSSSTAGYHDCSRIGGSPDPVRGKSRPKAPPASLTEVQGSVETTARVAPARCRRQACARHRWLRSRARSKRPLACRFLQRRRASQGSGAMPTPVRHASGSAPAAPVAAVSATGDRVLRGAVYRVVRRDGSVEYTNMRPAGQQDHAVTMLFSYIATCVACNLHSTSAGTRGAQPRRRMPT